MCCEACVCTKYTSHILLCVTPLDSVVRMQKDDIHLCSTVDLFNHTPLVRSFVRLRSPSSHRSRPFRSVKLKIITRSRKPEAKEKLTHQTDDEHEEKIDENDPRFSGDDAIWIHCISFIHVCITLALAALIHSFSSIRPTAMSYIDFLCNHTKASFARVPKPK